MPLLGSGGLAHHLLTSMTLRKSPAQGQPWMPVTAVSLCGSKLGAPSHGCLGLGAPELKEPTLSRRWDAMAFRLQKACVPCRIASHAPSGRLGLDSDKLSHLGDGWSC